MDASRFWISTISEAIESADIVELQKMLRRPQSDATVLSGLNTILPYLKPMQHVDVEHAMIGTLLDAPLGVEANSDLDSWSQFGREVGRKLQVFDGRSETAVFIALRLINANPNAVLILDQLYNRGVEAVRSQVTFIHGRRHGSRQIALALRDSASLVRETACAAVISWSDVDNEILGLLFESALSLKSSATMLGLIARAFQKHDVDANSARDAIKFMIRRLSHGPFAPEGAWALLPGL